MKLRFLKTLTYLGCALSFCLQHSNAEAIFASVKATGMAATCIAYPQDAVVGAYNPAGMAFVGDRYDIEAAWVHDRGRAHVSGNLSPLAPLVNGSFNGMRTKDVVPVGTGFNKTFCLCGWELSAGWVVYNRNYQKTTYTKPAVLFGTSNLGLEYLHETISPMVSVRLFECHSLGISLNYQVERLKVNGLENFDNPLRTTRPGHVTNKGYNYATGWGFTIGYYGQWTDCLSVGLTYQPMTEMSRLSKYKGFLAHHGRLNIPPKYGAGISYKVLPCVTVAFDVEYIQWDRVKALSNKLLHNGALELLGAQHGPGFGFRNQTYYRVGADWQINDCWVVRAGYRFARAPFPKSQTTVNLLTLDTVESFATVGATWSWDCQHEISGLFAWGFENTISGRNVIPVQFGGGNVKLKEQKYALGLSFGKRF